MDAQDIISHLESSGMSLKDMHELSGIGLSSLYAIRSGERSGETSLGTLQRLLSASQSYMALPALPSPVIEATAVVIDEHPSPLPQRTSARKPKESPPTRALQPYAPPQLSPDPARGMEYRAMRGRGVSPDELMNEIQGLRFEIHQLRQEQSQQQKQRVSQVRQRNEGNTGEPMADLIINGATLFKQLYDARQARKAEQQDSLPMLPQVAQYHQVPEYTSPLVQQAPTQPYRAYRRPGMYGLPSRRAPVQEKKPGRWQGFKKFLGF